MSIRIAIAGVAGRMGQALVRSAGADFTIAGGSERAGSDALGMAQGGWTVSDSATRAAGSADVWIDFTTPAASLEATAQQLVAPKSPKFSFQLRSLPQAKAGAAATRMDGFGSYYPIHGSKSNESCCSIS